MNQLTTKSLTPRKRRDDRAWTARVLFSGTAITNPRPRFLPLGKTVIGRAAEGHHDLCFASDAAMSRRHATVERTRSGLVLHDHSRNGSLLNREKASGVALADGDIVRCGNTFVLLRLEPIDPDDAHVEGFLGVSSRARQVRVEIARVAATDTTVVLHGETGTGKGLAARAIHELSTRSGPWLQLNCAAIPETLAESTLFGHVKGAFTHAERAQPGYFVDAHGGTLFIDEIGDLDLKLQPKILTVLDHSEVTPVGGTRPVSFDTRLIAASHRDLGDEVAAGRFRADLHARLAAITIRIPPLRERIEDMLGMLETRLGEHAPLTADLIDALVHYHWPYNAREVERVATELSVRGKGLAELDIDLIEDRLLAAASTPEPTATPETTTQAPPTQLELEALLKKHAGRVSSLAREVGRSTKQVYRWLSKHGLNPEDFRNP